MTLLHSCTLHKGFPIECNRPYPVVGNTFTLIMEKTLLVVLLVLSCSRCELACQSTETYAKIRKQCGLQHASEEKYQVLLNNEVVASSPVFVNNELRESEFCLPSSVHSVYTLKLIDQYGDGWDSKSWIEVLGPYSNIVFKNYLHSLSSEEYTISLYNPVPKDAIWKYKVGAVPSNWKESSLDASAWDSIHLGEETVTEGGNQFYRFSFDSDASMVVYELSLRYRHGIAAHVNGVEVFRDNLGNGALSPESLPEGSYDSYGYHHVIRQIPSSFAPQSTLAVEVHLPPSTTESEPGFNGWLSLYHATLLDSTCFAVASTAAVTASGGSDLNFLYDWNRESYWSVQRFTASVWARFDFGATRVEVNGAELWPGAMDAFFPRSYSLRTSSGAGGQVVVNKQGQTTTAFVALRHLNYFATSYQRFVTLEVTEVMGTKMYLAGLVPLVCRLTPPSAILYTPASLSLTINIDTVSLAPSVDGYSNCTIAPALPAGLAIDPATCVIEGTPTVALAATQFTVTSRMEGTHGGTLTGTLTLAVTDCGGNTLVVTRVYGDNSVREAFTLAQGEAVLFSEPFSSTQQDSSTRVTRLCALDGTVTLTLASQQSRWSSGSSVEIATESCGHAEPLLRARFDTGAGTPSQFTLHVVSLKKCQTPWHFKMGEAPSDWTSQDLSTWSEATKGSFPASPNQLQLYRSSFVVTNGVAGLAGVAGVRLLLRFQFGVVVYLNGREVYREGVTGPLSAASTSSSMRESADYYEITVPARLVLQAGEEGEVILREGANSIAVAVVATSPTQTASFFDGDVRLLYESSRVLQATVSSDDVPSAASSVDGDSATQVGSASCSNSIVFDMGSRREWVSAVVLQSSVASRGREPSHMVVEARNAEEWVTLGEFGDLEWWAQGQVKEIALVNHQAWRFYRVRDLYATSSACAWTLARIDLRVFDMVTPAAPLEYPTADVTSFLHIEFAEIYPTAMAYMQVSATPPLPAGIRVDSTSGVIHGTPTALSDRQTHTITAMKRTGGATTATLAFAVTVCSGGKSLITLTLRSDSDPASMRFSLYRGRGTMGALLSTVDALPSASTLLYYDFCLVHNIYSLLFQGAAAGWESDAGFMLTVDVGALRFELGQLPMRTGAGSEPATLSTAFSSYLPFQVGYTLWRVWTDYDVPAGWAEAAFDDSQWAEAKAAELGVVAPVTVYARRSFELSGVEDYNVLNVRVRYGGGVIAFFNGRQVARFNLPALVHDSTYAPAAHDPQAFSVFHVVLMNQGAVEGANVVAFELHRALSQAETEPVVFDATGVFGVEDCAVARDSYQAVTGSAPAEGTLDSLLDVSPLTTLQLANQEGSYVEWTLENEVPSQFNAYALYAYDTLVNLAYSVYGRRAEAEEWLTLDEQPSTFVRARARFTRAATLGIIGFKSLRFVLDAHLAEEPRFAAFVTLNCRVQGDVCPGVEDYPAVAEGQVSPAFCPAGYKGYAYRVCRNGRLGEVAMDRCAMRVPEKLTYGVSSLVFVRGAQNTSPQPTYEYIVQAFYLDDHVQLPPGLALDAASGRISGVPTEVMNATEYTVYAKNTGGATSVTISIAVREAYCTADGVFPETLAGNTAMYACSLDGAYLGTLKRVCQLGTKDGEWKAQTGLCIHVGVLAVFVVIVLLVIGFVSWFFALRRKGHKTMKAVPGSKGKTKSAAKSAATSTATSEAKKGLPNHGKKALKV